MSISEHIAEQAQQVDRKPSEPQKKVGNYRKGHIRIHGLDISIENPRGSYRSGKSPDGKTWRARLPAHYGYFKRTEGADGDHLDAFIGPHHKSPLVYVIDQNDLKSGKFDEHKTFIGFNSAKQVRNAYHDAFSDGRGKDRIGHLEEMTVDQFKDWLRDGDTKFPVKHRAEGGRVGMADGGTPPAFDPSQPFEPVKAPAFDPSAPFEPVQEAPQRGMLEAAGHGAMAGATFNMSDEMAGLRGASPSWVPETLGPVPVPTKMIAGAARLAKEHFLGGDEGTKGYEAARDEERRAQTESKAQHPFAYGAGELAGTVPAMAVMPEAGFIKGAGLLADVGRGAVAGAEYGGISGFGEGTDAGSRIESAGSGALGGAGAGAVAPVAGKVAGWAGDRFVRPAIETVKGWINPEGEAARRVATALQRDNEMIVAGTAKGMTPQEWVSAKHAGEPVTLADLGAGNTRALLRSAANTSPEGQAMLEKVIEDRFLSQGERTADTVRGLVAGGANAGKTSEDLVKAYDAGRKPLYKRAYQEGDREIMTPGMERLMGSPTFEDAMKRAVSTGKDRAISEGYGAFNPGVTVENGLIKFTKTKPTGVPQYPNLQYWDSVKRELDSMSNVARRQGDTSSVAGNLATTLRDELDHQVPSYGAARGFASQFFGENNALEAGQKLAGKKVTPDVIQKAMFKMKPDEKDLFREGYASDWANRVIGNMSQTRDITKAMFNSPNERARAEAVFGPSGVRQIEARMTLETVMDGARKAMGNSTTARQLIEAGLAGGALEGYLSGWDPTHIGMGALSGAGARKMLGAEMATGARKMIGKVDARTARYVADLLVSDDPRRLQQGLGLAVRSQKIMDGLKRVANTLFMSGAAPQGREAGIGVMPMIQGAAGARADDDPRLDVYRGAGQK